eukprot:401177-Rhodomonas_salina.1
MEARGNRVWSYRIVLRVCYGKSGTDVAYSATCTLAFGGADVGYGAMGRGGTDVGYGATRRGGREGEGEVLKTAKLCHGPTGATGPEEHHAALLHVHARARTRGGGSGGGGERGEEGGGQGGGVGGE